MRIPTIKKIEDINNHETIELDKLDASRRVYHLDNDKERFKFITTIEAFVRRSPEYSEFVKYLRDKMGMDFCSFFHKVDKHSYGKTRIHIEIHHEPIQLYDITAVVVNDRQSKGMSLDMYEIAEEITKLHYDGYVGLMPLSETVHELVHSGQLFIPLQYVDDGFKVFLQRYKDTIKHMTGLNDMLHAKLELSKRYAENPELFKEILKKKYIYVVNSNYSSIPEKIEVKK